MRLFRLWVFIILSIWIKNLQAQQLVLPGDFPDPSVTKIGDTYWATATTSNWMPAFPLLKSKDLVNWQPSGHVFYQKPTWADYYFWAPEISYEDGRVYIYYSAHKKGGNLCVGIASADKPEGPYKDHGPLICQPAGSIDAFPMRDEAGKLYLIWKEDGNSVNKPTSIWAQQINEERTGMMGEKTELFKNDADWERNLVEGVSIMKHGGYYYAFYAAAGCCGAGCTYATGIARAKKLLGPWEKYAKNPVLSNTDKWICPGHGTPVEKDGDYYFLYHAYDKESNIFTGRQGLLAQFSFTPGGWITFDKNVYNTAKEPAVELDDFKRSTLGESWQWSVFQQSNKYIRKGALQLSAMPNAGGAFVAKKTESPHYTVTTQVNLASSTAKAGLALIGDEKNMLGIWIDKDSVSLIKIKGGDVDVLLKNKVQLNKNAILQMRVNNGKDVTFLFGANKSALNIVNTTAIDGGYLPPWDRALRVGVSAQGAENTSANFEYFEIKNTSQ